MTKRQRQLTVAGVLVVLVASWWFMPFVWVRCSQVPVSFEEADLNADGRISFAEAEYITNSGRRTVNRSGHECTEFFSYKDATTIKVVCP